MDTSLKTYSDLSKVRPKPFLGYEGIGARFSVQKNSTGICIYESILSQLILILTLYLFGPGMNLLFYVKYEEISKKPMFIIIGITLFSLVGWIFGTKYLLRLLKKRRIEIDFNGGISLIESNSKIPVKINRNEIKKIEILESQQRIQRPSANPNYKTNYTLQLHKSDDTTIDLCTTDSLKNIESVKVATDLIFA